VAVAGRVTHVLLNVRFGGKAPPNARPYCLRAAPLPAQTRALPRALPGSTILQILPALANDHAGRAAVNVASSLLRSGARAMIASSGGRLVGELQALGGEWMQVPGATLNPVRLMGNARKLAEVIHDERVDIVHAYSGPTAWVARQAIGSSGALLVTSYFGGPVPGMGATSYYQAALARGARVLVDSEYAADLIAKRHGVPIARMIVMPRSVDTTRFDPPAVSAERVAILRHGWHIRPGVRGVLIPGTLTPAKGQMTVVDAARILVNGGLRGVAFVIMANEGSDSDYSRAVNERIEAQGLGGLFRRIGHCSDMPAAYGVADMVVVPAMEPSTYDRIAVEAMAMARQVVASAVGVLPEIVRAPPYVPEDERTGWLVSPSDPVDLARAVAEVLALDVHTRRIIARRSRQLAEQFSPDRLAAATLAVYTSLLEGER
jgi:glycosyltransferase involved in cell wall biosynthesis